VTGDAGVWRAGFGLAASGVPAGWEGEDARAITVAAATTAATPATPMMTFPRSPPNQWAAVFRLADDSPPGPSFEIALSARLRARCSRTLAAPWLMPSAFAASACDNPSHPTRSSSSRSESVRRASATRSRPRSAQAASRSSTASQSIPKSRVRPRAGCCCLKCLRSTFRPIPYSQGSALPLSWAATREDAERAAMKTSDSRSSAAGGPARLAR
jgi:hypothetical protein